MYEAWAFYHPNPQQNFLSKTTGEFYCEFDNKFKLPKMNVDSALEAAISNAVYTV
jgi:hypothetical protein